jgi:hypothetical protein
VNCNSSRLATGCGVGLGADTGINRVELQANILSNIRLYDRPIFVFISPLFQYLNLL